MISGDLTIPPDISERVPKGHSPPCQPLLCPEYRLARSPQPDKVLTPLNLLGVGVSGYFSDFFPKKNIDTYDSGNNCTLTHKHITLAKKRRLNKRTHLKKKKRERSLLPVPRKDTAGEKKKVKQMFVKAK